LKLIETVSTLFNKGMKAKAAREAKVMAENPGAEMSLVSHVVELRRHLVRALLWLLGFTIVAIVFMKPLVKFLRYPFEQYQLGKGQRPDLMAIGLFEVILMNFKICFMVGLVAAAPFMVRELWAFVAPALYDHEKRVARPFVILSFLLFYLGISFGFFVIVPAFLGNTLEWAQDYANVQLTVDSYFSSLSTMVMIFGIIFEVPVAMSLLGLVGIINSEMLSKNRRVVILAAFVIGAVISPPDVLSQVLVSVPLWFMIEISIIALRVIESRRAKGVKERLDASGSSGESGEGDGAA
jgi:sec-independent protein translocase protein TatC